MLYKIIRKEEIVLSIVGITINFKSNSSGREYFYSDNRIYDYSNLILIEIINNHNIDIKNKYYCSINKIKDEIEENIKHEEKNLETIKNCEEFDIYCEYFFLCNAIDKINKNITFNLYDKNRNLIDYINIDSVELMHS